MNQKHSRRVRRSIMAKVTSKFLAQKLPSDYSCHRITQQPAQ